MHFDSRKLGIVAGAITLAAAGAAVAYADSTFSEPTNVPPATTTGPAQAVVAPETETEAEDSLDEQTDARPDLDDLPPLPAANAADDDDKQRKTESKVADDDELEDDEVEDVEKPTPAVEQHEDDEDLDEQGDQDDDDQGENEDDDGSHEEDGD